MTDDAEQRLFMKIESLTNRIDQLEAQADALTAVGQMMATYIDNQESIKGNGEHTFTKIVRDIANDNAENAPMVAAYVLGFSTDILEQHKGKRNSADEDTKDGA